MTRPAASTPHRATRTPVRPQYEAVAVGTGFATSFFLHEHLRRAPANARILVLERGPRISHAERVARRLIPGWAREDILRRAGADPRKQWAFSLGFGGSSNCWWGCTPRMMPSDFRLRSLHGVGRDWPIDYATLESCYEEVEEIMQISGAADGAPYPRARPHPQPPHRFSDPDRLLKAKYPTLFFNQPTARARVATGSRPPCCGNAVCHLCPVDAKFTIENGLAEPYRDPRVELATEAEALGIDIAAGLARAVRFRRNGREERAAADLVVLGANAIFNPFLMLRSGMDEPALGRGLAEQVSVRVDADLRGVENFQGSTSITGHGYMFYGGPHRAERAACLVETWNAPHFRLEPGRWRERLSMKFIAEDLPQEANRVAIDPERPDRPLAIFNGHSAYAQAALDRAGEMAAEMLDGLPVERIHAPAPPSPTEGHVQCTTRMGTDPEDSVVDAGLVSHRVRNLVVLGASVFPTAAPANPTLTLSALSIHAARRLA